MITESLKIASHITTTTKVFAEEIKKLNKNVTVLPNTVNPRERQFHPKKTDSDLIRIGWLGGSSHLKDLEILSGLPQRLNGTHKGKFQFVLCGYDLRGSVTVINPQTKEQQVRDIEPHESVWYLYENIFTDKFKILSDEYKKHLHKWEKGGIDDSNLPYKRVWTKPITT